MIKDNSFGIVPLTKRKGSFEVFLIQHRNGGHWGFPKGHSEKGESPKEAAERELFEETAMQIIHYLDTPPLVEKYQFKRAGELIDKTVHFYLAEVTAQYTLQTEEIIAGAWMPPSALLSYAIFPEEKALYHSLMKLLADFFFW